MKFDVLVVGAGPAGSMTAKTVAKKGYETALIDRNINIGSPIRCAEGINKYLFKDTGIKKDKSFISQKIRGTNIYFYDEMYELTDEQWQGYTVDRKVFDTYLAKQAELSGAEVIKNTKAISLDSKKDRKIITVVSNGKTKKIESKIVVGADGFECRIGRWAGLIKKWKVNEFSKCFELVLGNLKIKGHDRFHMAFGEEFPYGYAWVFPKSRYTANVGVGIDARFSAREALDFFINEYPNIKEIIGDSYTILETRGGYIPTTGPRPIAETVGEGIVLVGDAAGIVDPITGEGITPAMLSGISAGEAISKSLKDNDWGKESLALYYDIWRNKRYVNKFKLGEDLDMLREIKPLFFDTFTNRKIPKIARKLFMKALITEEYNEYNRYTEKIRDIVNSN